MKTIYVVRLTIESYRALIGLGYTVIFTTSKVLQ